MRGKDKTKKGFTDCRMCTVQYSLTGELGHEIIWLRAIVPGRSLGGLRDLIVDRGREESRGC